jgi:hypothetical protein
MPCSAAVIEITTGEAAVDGAWSIETIYGSGVPLEGTLSTQVWWGNEVLARVFAASLGGALNPDPLSPDRPLFATTTSSGVWYYPGLCSPAVCGVSFSAAERYFAVARRAADVPEPAPLGMMLLAGALAILRRPVRH